MISETDVIMAYRLIMGREPDNDQVIKGHAAQFDNLLDLRAGFMASDEFRRLAKQPVLAAGDRGVKPLNWPPIGVEVDVTPDLLDRMIKRIEHEFHFLGGTEPHWSVLTADRFKAAHINEHAVEFYESGVHPVDDMLVAAARAGIDLSAARSCFELGCGVGRSTIWLARHFQTVVAGDISATHLEHARIAAARASLPNVMFAHLNEIGRYGELPPFDVFFSTIVLQHNPPPLMAHILETILTRLRPGGIAYFQIPTYLADYSFSAETYLNSEAPVGDVEVHCVPQHALFKIIDRTNCEVLEMREDSSLGVGSISNRLLLKKGEGRTVA